VLDDIKVVYWRVEGINFARVEERREVVRERRIIGQNAVVQQVSQLLVAGPLIALYFLGVALSFWLQPKAS